MYVVDTFSGIHGTISSVVVIIIIVVGYIRRSIALCLLITSCVSSHVYVLTYIIVEEVGEMKLPLFCFFLLSHLPRSFLPPRSLVTARYQNCVDQTHSSSASLNSFVE